MEFRGNRIPHTPNYARKSDIFAGRSNVTVPSCGSVILSPNPYDDFETGGSSCCNSASGNRRNNCEGSSERYMDDLDRPRCEEAYQMC
uniref:Uncharacterized protein n=1 Tax=Panagrolaimus sp. JU765 TaxID=591449 RepID=A0AC34RAF3_9BILA